MSGLWSMLKAARNWAILRAIARWLSVTGRAGALACIVFAAFAADAKGIPASIAERRGLTNEQIDYILERHPDVELKISRKDWVGMRLELMRFHNLTNWVDTFNGRQGFADALATAQETARALATQTNALANAKAAADRLAEQWRARSAELEQSAKTIAGDLSTATNRIAALSADIADREKRLADAETKAAKVKSHLEEKANSGTVTQKAIYKALLTWYNSLTAD